MLFLHHSKRSMAITSPSSALFRLSIDALSSSLKDDQLIRLLVKASINNLLSCSNKLLSSILSKNVNFSLMLYFPFFIYLPSQSKKLIHNLKYEFKITFIHLQNNCRNNPTSSPTDSSPIQSAPVSFPCHPYL